MRFDFNKSFKNTFTCYILFNKNAAIYYLNIHIDELSHITFLHENSIERETPAKDFPKTLIDERLDSFKLYMNAKEKKRRGILSMNVPLCAEQKVDPDMNPEMGKDKHNSHNI